MNDDDLAAAFGAIAVEAGAVILATQARGLVARGKSDGSPVTDADVAAEALIAERLQTIAPGIRIIAEESFSRDGDVAPGAEFILVDPLDGTREFVAGRDEYTVNIGLIRDGRPVVGAVYAPARGRLWVGAGAAYVIDADAREPLPDRRRWRQIHTRAARIDAMAALVSRSHLDADSVALLARLGVRERVEAGSSLKFCLLAEGAGDLYPRFGPTMEWDTAAGDAILRAAGGAVVGLDGKPLAYGIASRRFLNAGFVAVGDPGLVSRLGLGARPSAQA